MKDLHDEERRVTDYATGGQKGTKLTRAGAMDPAALSELFRVAGMGAEKYAAFNYLKGFDWSLAYNAMQRHALLFWAGEDNDPESGLSHMAHAAWMALALVSFAMRELGTDDRFVQPPRRTIDWGLYEEVSDDYGNPYLRRIEGLAVASPQPVGHHEYDDHATEAIGTHSLCQPCVTPGCNCHHPRDRKGT